MYSIGPITLIKQVNENIFSRFYEKREKSLVLVTIQSDLIFQSGRFLLI